MRFARIHAAIAVAIGLSIVGCGDAGPSGGVVQQPSCVTSVGDVPVSGPVQAIPLFPSASDARGRAGFARIINHSAEAGSLSIRAFDDEGKSYGPLRMSVGVEASAHLTSDDLETGNSAAGLTGCIGAGRGDWRLEIASELDIEVLSYIRTSDGFLTSMHDKAPWRDGGFVVANFDPAIDRSQESLLRLVNAAETASMVTITGTDETGAPGAGQVTVEVPARASRTFSAADLESGSATGLDGSLGDGEGIWRLDVRSEQAITAVSLRSNPSGHLTNLSTMPANETGGIHRVPLFPSASDPSGRLGLVRVINRSNEVGEVSISAFDDTGREYEVPVLTLGANETKQFDSNDLEFGNPEKGLTGSTGAGGGDWRLALTSALDIAVLSYVMTNDGFLASVHDTVPPDGGTHRVAVFNPASEVDQVSRLRLVNAGEATADVRITGIDDRGRSSSGEVSVAIPAGASRVLTAQDLEAGVDGAEGAIGDGEGRWQLVVESERPITVLSLLSSRDGHLVNLSSRPVRTLTHVSDFQGGAQGFVADFADYPPAHKEIFDLTSDYRPLPAPLEANSALYISGVNRSDDLFMFFRGRIGGLIPGAAYEAAVSVEIVTNTPSGCIGIGGAPGESVWIKAGATETEPLAVLKDTYLRMNIDVGNQSNGGDNAVVLGNVANSRSCEESRRWERKDFEARQIPAPVRASSNGRVWLLFGVDSGFEGRTGIYFTRASVEFTPI